MRHRDVQPHRAVTRRRLLVAFAALTGARALTTFGQERGLARLALLSTISASDRDDAFVQALRDFGHVEGRNIVIERHYLQGQTDRLAVVAAELVRRNPDIIFAPQTIAAAAARKATSTIPIVFAVAPDPVGSGLVASLARPGGNATGLSSISTELNAKRLELLREAFPKTSRVAVFRSAEPIVVRHVEEVERAAKALGIKTHLLQLQRADEIEQCLAQLREWNADAIYIVQSSTNFNNRKLLAELSAAARLPAMFPYSESAEAGGLMSYGTDFDGLYRQAAGYVSRILKGAKPADLPVEQPTRFEFVINLRTAKALKLMISPAVLARADKVIE